MVSFKTVIFYARCIGRQPACTDYRPRRSPQYQCIILAWRLRCEASSPPAWRVHQALRSGRAGLAGPGLPDRSLWPREGKGGRGGRGGANDDNGRVRHERAAGGRPGRPARSPRCCLGWTPLGSARLRHPHYYHPFSTDRISYVFLLPLLRVVSVNGVLNGCSPQPTPIMRTENRLSPVLLDFRLRKCLFYVSSESFFLIF